MDIVFPEVAEGRGIINSLWPQPTETSSKWTKSTRTSERAVVSLGVEGQRMHLKTCDISHSRHYYLFSPVLWTPLNWSQILFLSHSAVLLLVIWVKWSFWWKLGQGLLKNIFAVHVLLRFLTYSGCFHMTFPLPDLNLPPSGTAALLLGVRLCAL